MNLRSLSRANVAEYAGTTRAAVTKWFQSRERDWINVETGTIIRLAESLNISPAWFLTPNENLEKLHARYLWDNLYPTMDNFLKAVRERRPPAVARLVQVAGFRAALHIAGKTVLGKFTNYAKYIHPIRRKELETLWPLYHSAK